MTTTINTQPASTGGGLPPGVEETTNMVEAMEGEAAALGQYSSTNTISQMDEANANTLSQIANLDDVNSQMEQVMQQQNKEQNWGIIGDVCSFALTVCLAPIDPILSLMMAGGQAVSLSGLTKDVVGWISDGIQDICPNMDDAWSKALADVILVVAVVAAAVVIGVLTAGAGDAVIAEGVADVVGEEVVTDLAGDVGTELMDMAGSAIEDAVGDAVGSAVEDATTDVASDAGSSAKKAVPTGNRVKRGAKLGIMMGAQMTMQTNAMPNTVAAIASTSSDPDSPAWKWAELGAFIAQTILCVGASIGSAFIEAPSIVSDATKGSSTFQKIRKAGRTGALISGLSEAFSNGVSGGYGLAAAANTNQLKDSASDQILLTSMTEMNNQTGEEIQKGITELQSAIFNDQDLAHILTGYQMEA